jgi:hemoglobin
MSTPARVDDSNAPRRDVEDADLEPLLRRFYDVLTIDPLLARYFEHVDMAEHIPRIADFWSTLLFNTRRYSDNAFRPHLAMPELSAERFARWVETMEQTVDRDFEGPAAERMKALAHRIAYSMQLRLGIEPFAPYREDVGIRLDKPDSERH